MHKISERLGPNNFMVKRTILSAFLGASFCLGFVSCSENRATTQALDPKDFVGTWEVTKASKRVMAALPATNSIKDIRIVFSTNENVTFQVFPIVPRSSWPASTWAFFSGKGEWQLDDLGTSNRHDWRVRIRAEGQGVHLWVSSKSRGKLRLEYFSHGDDPVDLIYERVPAEKQP